MKFQPKFDMSGLHKRAYFSSRSASKYLSKIYIIKVSRFCLYRPYSGWKRALQFFPAPEDNWILHLVYKNTFWVFVSFCCSASLCGVLYWKTIRQLRSAKASDRNRRRFNQLTVAFFALYVSWVIMCGPHALLDMFFVGDVLVYFCHAPATALPISFHWTLHQV